MTKSSYHPEAVPLPDLRPDVERAEASGEERARPQPGERRDPADVERQSVSPAGDPPEARVEESR